MIIRDFVSRHSYLTPLYKITRMIYLFHVEDKLRDAKVFYRKIKGDRNMQLEELHNKFVGERCFIVCNGPSLTIEDLNKLKNEYCFSMNSVINGIDKTDWYPMFYGIQDMNVYKKILESVLNCKSKYIFISDEVRKFSYPSPHDAILFKHYQEGNYPDNPYPNFRFSNDAALAVFDGFSIAYSLLQIACYLGFREIYLIGNDCSYSVDPQKQHFANSGHVDPNAYRIGAKQIQAYKCAKKYCDANGIKVYNATRGGALEVFPRVNIDDMQLK